MGTNNAWFSRDINNNLSFTLICSIFSTEYVLFQGFPQMSKDLGWSDLAGRRVWKPLKALGTQLGHFLGEAGSKTLNVLPVPRAVLQRGSLRLLLR